MAQVVAGHVRAGREAELLAWGRATALPLVPGVFARVLESELWSGPRVLGPLHAILVGGWAAPEHQSGAASLAPRVRAMRRRLFRDAQWSTQAPRPTAGLLGRLFGNQRDLDELTRGLVLVHPDCPADVWRQVSASPGLARRLYGELVACPGAPWHQDSSVYPELVADLMDRLDGTVMTEGHTGALDPAIRRRLQQLARAASRCAGEMAPLHFLQGALLRPDLDVELRRRVALYLGHELYAHPALDTLDPVLLRALSVGGLRAPLLTTRSAMAQRASRELIARGPDDAGLAMTDPAAVRAHAQWRADVTLGLDLEAVIGSDAGRWVGPAIGGVVDDRVRQHRPPVPMASSDPLAARLLVATARADRVRILALLGAQASPARSELPGS